LHNDQSPVAADVIFILKSIEGPFIRSCIAFKASDTLLDGGTKTGADLQGVADWGMIIHLDAPVAIVCKNLRLRHELNLRQEGEEMLDYQLPAR